MLKLEVVYFEHHRRHYYRRELYDQAYLDANCSSNATLVPFDPANGIDSSIATFMTNYAIAIVAFLMGGLILRRAIIRDTERAGFFVSLYLIAQGLAFLFAGIGHQFTEEDDELLNQILIRMVAFFGLGGSFLLLRTLILYFTTTFDGWIRQLLWVTAISLTAVATAFAFGGGAAIVVLGNVGILLLALCMHGVHCCRDDERRKGHFLKFLGVFLLIVGGIIQLTLSSSCGYAAYENCFMDCPLPAPDFNHNALFHVFAFFSYLLYGWGELILPAHEVVLQNRRRSTEENEEGKQEEFIAGAYGSAYGY